MSNKMLKLAYEFRRILEEAKEVSRQQRREQALVAQLGGRGDVIETVGLQPASDTHNKKVENIARIIAVINCVLFIYMYLLFSFYNT